MQDMSDKICIFKKICISKMLNKFRNKESFYKLLTLPQNRNFSYNNLNYIPEKINGLPTYLLKTKKIFKTIIVRVSVT